MLYGTAMAIERSRRTDYYWLNSSSGPFKLMHNHIAQHLTVFAHKSAVVAVIEKTTKHLLASSRP